MGVLISTETTAWQLNLLTTERIMNRIILYMDTRLFSTDDHHTTRCPFCGNPTTLIGLHGPSSEMIEHNVCYHYVDAFESSPNVFTAIFRSAVPANT
jgi:hypothetical protein